MYVPCLASSNRTTTSTLNSLLIWQLCSNHDEELLVMHEDLQASPRCLKSCSHLLLSCMARNCPTPSRHGHLLGVWSILSFLLGAYFVFIVEGIWVLFDIHQRMCVTPSYFPSTRLGFWYYALISDALLVCSLFIPLACKYTFETLLISFKIVFAENTKSML